jgi:5-methylcytosine-specific restriction enzyme subunit McrC
MEKHFFNSECPDIIGEIISYLDINNHEGNICIFISLYCKFEKSEEKKDSGKEKILNCWRKNSHYQSAIEISAMLLLNYRPDISSGNNKILAILFDMNSLWEEYIYRQIEKWNTYNWNIAPQDQSDFWRQLDTHRKKIIKPDIVISNGLKTIIIDTKWKLPEDDIPSDSDLKQMYVYNEYWEGMTSILLYPYAIFRENPIFIKGIFNDIPNLNNYSKTVNGNYETLEMHSCGIIKISVTKDKILDENIGQRIINFLNENIFNEL